MESIGLLVGRVDERQQGSRARENGRGRGRARGPAARSSTLGRGHQAGRAKSRKALPGSSRHGRPCRRPPCPPRGRRSAAPVRGQAGGHRRNTGARSETDARTSIPLSSLMCLYRRSSFSGLIMSAMALLDGLDEGRGRGERRQTRSGERGSATVTLLVSRVRQWRNFQCYWENPVWGRKIWACGGGGGSTFASRHSWVGRNPDRHDGHQRCHVAMMGTCYHLATLLDIIPLQSRTIIRPPMGSHDPMELEASPLVAR